MSLGPLGPGDVVIRVGAPLDGLGRVRARTTDGRLVVQWEEGLALEPKADLLRLNGRDSDALRRRLTACERAREALVHNHPAEYATLALAFENS